MKNGLPFQRSKQLLDRRRRRRLIYVKTFAGKAVVVVITGTPYLRPEGGAYFKKGRKLGKHSESVDDVVASGGEFINSPKVGRGPPNDAQEKVPKCGRAE